MIAIDHNEAILFRLLGAFFGQDKVIPHMSVLAACGGELPKRNIPVLQELANAEPHTIRVWARQRKCLFTIVNEFDAPRLVVELGVDVKSSIDLSELDKQEEIRPILNAAGVPYIVISRSELKFICDPANPDNWFHVLQSKFEEASAALAA